MYNIEQLSQFDLSHQRRLSGCECPAVVVVVLKCRVNVRSSLAVASFIVLRNRSNNRSESFMGLKDFDRDLVN